MSLSEYNLDIPKLKPLKRRSSSVDAPGGHASMDENNIGPLQHHVAVPLAVSDSGGWSWCPQWLRYIHCESKTMWDPVRAVYSKWDDAGNVQDYCSPEQADTAGGLTGFSDTNEHQPNQHHFSQHFAIPASAEKSEDKDGGSGKGVSDGEGESCGEADGIECLSTDDAPEESLGGDESDGCFEAKDCGARGTARAAENGNGESAGEVIMPSATSMRS